MAKLGSVRRSQLITTYGIGALIPVGEESVIVAGADFWPVGTADLQEPRLARKLDVRGFVRPPASGKDGGKDIPVVRFPEMYSCPACKRLAKHSHLAEFNKNECNACGSILIPSRFVMVCDKGHIDDFPYFEWVHCGKPVVTGHRHELSIDTEGASASLSDIKISCSCGLSQNMKGAFAKSSLKDLKKCTGYRPWLGDAEPGCTEIPRTLQRGASNVYFAVTSSALSIPPWSEGAFKIINRHWLVLQAIPEVALYETISTMQLTKGTAYKAEDLVLAVQQRKNGEGPPLTNTSLRVQEYEALVLGKEEVSRDQDFVSVLAKDSLQEVAPWFDRIMLVKRLREVRALEAFTRLRPPSPGDSPDRWAALARTKLDWLPAIEVLGEGIFIRLNADVVHEWEIRQDVKERAKKIDANYRSHAASFGVAADRIITPRFILIHTLAHLLITQWALECGYPAASLRERLYVSQPNETEMLGFLVYTATTDSAGSLGGIIAQGRPGRLGLAIREAVQRASWCSADPLCIEADAAGVDSLNLAACHACMLLPEVSCEESNMLLDRALLVGTLKNQGMGFFEELLETSGI